VITRYVMRDGDLVCIGEAPKPSATGLQIINDTSGYQYDCPVTGEWINSRSKHRENLMRTDSRVLEKGEKEHASKSRRENLDRQIERIVDRSLPYA